MRAGEPWRVSIDGAPPIYGDALELILNGLPPGEPYLGTLTVTGEPCAGLPENCNSFKIASEAIIQNDAKHEATRRQPKLRSC